MVDETRPSKKPKTIENAKLDLPSPSPPPPVDRLTLLPDTVLAAILSLIPTKAAICTSVLSTRWRYLWTQLTNIDLDCRKFPRHAADFYPVVDQLLTRLNSPLLRKLSLQVPYARKQTFDLWLRHLCTRNVQYIDINVEGNRYGVYDGPACLTLPLSIFQVMSLRQLTLPSSCLNYQLPIDTDLIFKLPNLIVLEISLPPLQCGLLAKLLRFCPLLEDLSLTTIKPLDNGSRDDGELIDISCPNMKKLTLIFYASTENTEVVIDVPKLNVLYLFASRLGDCSFVNKPNVLRDAFIVFKSHDVVLSLLPMITNVSSLRLYAEIFVAMLKSFKDNPVNSNSLNFHNLIELEVDISNKCKSPNPFLHHSTSTSLLLHVKRITVTIYELTHKTELKKLVEFLLRNAPNMKRLTLHPYRLSKEPVDEVPHKVEEMSFCIDLYSWERNSSKCKIDFLGQHAQVPTNDTKLREMENHVRLLRQFLKLQGIVRAF